MGKGEGRRGLTPEQKAERFSAGGPGFEDALRHVPAGGPDDEQEGAEMGEHSGVAERELTEEEIVAILADPKSGLFSDAPVFYDAETVNQYMRDRFGV